MNNNLVNHEMVDTFYMTDEQLAEYKKKRASKAYKKAIAKMLLGTASIIGFGALVPVLASVIPAGLVAVPMVASGIVSFSGFFKFMSILNQNENTETMENPEKENGEKHR